jgi:V8-like Glu-specific endopeptidase
MGIKYRAKDRSVRAALTILTTALLLSAALAAPALADQQSSRAFGGSAKKAQVLHRQMRAQVGMASKAMPMPTPVASPGESKPVSEDDLINGFGTVTRKSDGRVVRDKATPAVKAGIKKLKLPAPDQQPANTPDNLRRVIGPDDRVYIGDTTRYPFRTVGLVESSYASGTYWCSGTLVGKQYVLTAAHCLFDVNTLSWPSTVSFYPGRNGNFAPYGYYWAREWHVPSGFVDAPGRGYTRTRERYDLGVMKLYQQPGVSVGWLGFGYNDNLPDFDANIVGYPSDKPSGTMWRSSCSVNPASGAPYFFNTTCDTYPGSSGSATYDYEPSDQTRLILGVNVSETPGDDNHSVRISSAYFEWLCERTRCRKTK